MLRRLVRRCSCLLYFMVSLTIAALYWRVIGFDQNQSPIFSDNDRPGDETETESSRFSFMDTIAIAPADSHLEELDDNMSDDTEGNKPALLFQEEISAVALDTETESPDSEEGASYDSSKTAGDNAGRPTDLPEESVALQQDVEYTTQSGVQHDPNTSDAENTLLHSEQTKKQWKFVPKSEDLTPEPKVDSVSNEAKHEDLSSKKYTFSPYMATEDELDGKDTMDYVKGLGYLYIYNNDTYIDHELNANISMKTILLWNNFYDDADYKFGVGHHPFKTHFCIINKCRTTTDRSELKTADMVIFFIFGLDFTKPNTIPRRGHPDQLYVFWNHESPFYKTKNKLRRFRNVFNLTVSYRLDSSISLPLYQTRARVQRKLHPLVSKYHLRNKKKLAVWMISACHKIGSLRLPYERQLERYMPIDTYGACGNISCPINETQECLTDMEKNYKFYLAFENSMCRDYITEKAYRTLYGNWVPVVMGAGDYVKHLPPHSFIDVRDFDSPRHLAEYLLYLDQNDEEYLKYFDWKKDWIVWRVHTKVALCELCELLHIGSNKIRSDLDVHDWWEVQGECVKPEALPSFLKLNMMN